MDRRRRRRCSKRDGNHQVICDALRGAGRSVLELDDVGSGTPDILVGWGRSKMLLMEIKDPAGRDRVEPKQAIWHREWKGNPVIVVRSVAEALEATGVRPLARNVETVGRSVISSVG